MFSLDRTLAISPYSTVSTFLARFSCLLAFLFPATKHYLLNNIVSIEDGGASVIIGACFIFAAWRSARLWTRYRTRKYLVMQVVLLTAIVFELLTQLVTIPHILHATFVVTFLAVLFLVAKQRDKR